MPLNLKKPSAQQNTGKYACHICRTRHEEIDLEMLYQMQSKGEYHAHVQLLSSSDHLFTYHHEIMNGMSKHTLALVPIIERSLTIKVVSRFRCVRNTGLLAHTRSIQKAGSVHACSFLPVFRTKSVSMQKLINHSTVVVLIVHDCAIVILVHESTSLQELPRQVS